MASTLASAAGLIDHLSEDDTAPAPDESQKVIHRTTVDKSAVRTTNITLSNTGQTEVGMDGAVLGRWLFDIPKKLKDTKKLPRVHAFSENLKILDIAPTPGKPVTLSRERKHLPAFVIADGANQSGIIFAVSPGSFWQFDIARTKSGRLDVTLVMEGIDRKLAPGDSITAPRVIVIPYKGQWRAGLKRLGQLLNTRKTDPTLKAVAASFDRAEARKLYLLALWFKHHIELLAK
jgi:hypothetical protein